MESEITNVNIVILANNHNPAIPTKDWLIKKKIFNDDEVGDFLSTPVFSVFNGKNYLLQVDEKRLQLNVKNIKELNINDLSNKIITYIESLPEIPYFAIGFNLHRGYQPSTVEEKIINRTKESFCKDIKEIGKILGNNEFRYGNTFIFQYEDIGITIQIKPDIVKENFILSFNFHRDIRKSEQDNKIEIIKNFIKKLNNYLDKANEIARSFFS